MDYDPFNPDRQPDLKIIYFGQKEDYHSLGTLSNVPRYIYDAGQPNPERLYLSLELVAVPWFVKELLYDCGIDRNQVRGPMVGDVFLVVDMERGQALAHRVEWNGFATTGPVSFCGRNAAGAAMRDVWDAIVSPTSGKTA